VTVITEALLTQNALLRNAKQGATVMSSQEEKELPLSTRLPRGSSKRVRFLDSNGCIQIPHYSHFSPEVIAADDDVCARGLEHLFMPDYSKRRLDVRTFAKNAVLAEQDRQLSDNSFNAELIAAAYRGVSLYARKVAYSIATQDERDAQQELRGCGLLEASNLPSKETKENKTFKHRVKLNQRTSFNQRASIRLIPHMKELSEEEESLRWYRRGGRT
jgi:hypothetical protein